MNPLQLLEDPLRWLLDFLHDPLALTYGWSIVVLTVLVRTALLPLVIKQYRSMRQMQVVAPQLKELQRKHKGDRAKTQEEMMKFYRENEINPFASCLPLVAQIPVFIALYYVLRSFAEQADKTGGESVSFMWIISDITVDFQELGWVSVVPLLLVYGLTQLLSTELSATPNMPDSQRRIMRFLPLVIVIFVLNFPVPAGLVLYWMSTNLWTCGQQLVMRHRIGLHLADDVAVAAEKKGSRTPAKAEAKSGARTGGGKAVADEPVTAPEPTTAPEATSAPVSDPVDAPEDIGASEVESVDAAESEAKAAPSGGSSKAGSGNRQGAKGGGAQKRRQPRPRKVSSPGRPAQARRSSNKKKR